MNHLPEETSDLIHRRLLSIGALPIHQFASFGLKNISTPQTDGQLARQHDSDSNFLVLTTACLRQFGKSHDVLKTEFLQHSAVDRQCVLTIQLPGGPSRSYRSEPFPDSEDAVEGAADSAIKDGALDFILFGENEILKLKSNTDEGLEHASTASSDELEAAETLEECWRIWRGDASHLLWFRFDEVSVPGLCGCALKVELTPHCYRVYSSQLDYADLQSAKTHCARNAIANGALHFIQHGDGQIEPRSCPMSLPASLQAGARWNLQNFFESFARPSAEEFSSKIAGMIDGQGLLSKLASRCGSNALCTYYRLQSGQLYGALIRLTRAAKSWSYLLEPRCPTYKEARAAVALLALSQGLGNVLRELRAGSPAAVSAVPEAARSFVSKTAYAFLSKYTSVRSARVAYQYQFDDCDRRHGCTLSVTLEPHETDTRQYVAPPLYGSRQDAKVAVVYLAFEQGVADFMICRGQLPPGHQPCFDLTNGPPSMPSSKKHKMADGPSQPPPPSKKQKSKEHQESELEEGEVLE